MNDDYVMRPGDVFVARECGCSVTVNTAPSDASMATRPPMCCCGHEMIKDASFIGGIDVVDIPTVSAQPTVLPGMIA
jgi:hypothetical protein